MLSEDPTENKNTCSGVAAMDHLSHPPISEDVLMLVVKWFD